MNFRPPPQEYTAQSAQPQHQPPQQAYIPPNRDFSNVQTNNATFSSPYSARQASTVIYTSERGPGWFIYYSIYKILLSIRITFIS